MNRNAFVFVVCGSLHAARARLAIKFLRRFSRSEIIVVRARTRERFDADRVIDAKTPTRFNQQQAAIFLKTSLPKILKPGPGIFCYLDNDVVAVSSEADAIFGHFKGPVTFAPDHCSLREFSQYAVKCNCTRQECDHLRAAIRRRFRVDISDKKWRHWNGGVILFDASAAAFFERWHKHTLAIFRDRYWRARDQGTLAATAWELKLQKHPTLPREFNFVVDPWHDLARSKRASAKNRKFTPVESYSLQNESSKSAPQFLHFINGGIGLRGWKNWDDAAALLEPAQTSAALSPDNRIVHGLWIGRTLSRMELLTLRSFIRHGHEFHLWAYDKIETPLPPGVILEDANRIIPRSQIIKRADTDTETGVGKGSFSSPFSDLFRYKLLYEKGGYWVDMDVTCLRPFNFSAPYLFRPHRVGVVGNIIKCPPRCPLMKTVYSKVARIANEHTDWLLPNKILSQTIQRLKLSQYIRGGIWNQESWWDAIRPLALETAPIPSDWFAIHWINEFWRTLKESGGVYRGRRLFTTVPEKDRPHAGSALARLYAEYGLGQPQPTQAAAPPAPPSMPLEAPAERQPATPQFLMTSHINVLLPSLTRGGAERSVVETLSGLQRRNSSGNLFVLYNAKPAYHFDGTGNIKLCNLAALDLPAKLHAVAMGVLTSPNPVLFTHMVKVEMLRVLWERGVKTIPVIQNSRPAWQDPPSAFNHPCVPFVAAVSEDVARQLRQARCPKPVVVVRHELQRWFTPEEQQKNRRHIRERYGIGDDVLVIGMVGQFKSQKSYTRAVRVLAQIRRIRPAKLMILGGWDTDWGHARQAYTATCRLALELEAITDLITPGPVPDPEQYYAAFDVFLNTSAYEGLSVALLEAIQTGCPIVTADAGGNREVLPERAVLVSDPSDTNAYVRGIAQALQSKSRTLPPKPVDFDLVPRLWCLLGQYGRQDSFPTPDKRAGTLFLTDILAADAEPRSLVALLRHLAPKAKPWLCVLYNTPGQVHLDALQKSGVPVFSMQNCSDYLERAERILSILGRLNIRQICFWNVDPRLKLLLAKILATGTFRLVDASLDGSAYSRMEYSAGFQRRIAFPAKDYWPRLDQMVAKYPGAAPSDIRLPKQQFTVIPDGVPVPSAGEPATQLLPRNTDPNLVIGACCTLAAGKRIEFLIETMVELNRQFKGATLLVIGGIDPNKKDYWPMLQEILQSRKITNICFAGPHTELAPVLKVCKVFLAVSEWPGFPPGCLEAMALGLPVVTNSAQSVWSRYTARKKGFAVHANGPQTAAQYLRELLADAALRRWFGKTARTVALKEFPQAETLHRYQRLLTRS